MTQKIKTVEIKIQKKFMWLVSCPDLFNKGPDMSDGRTETRLYWALFTEPQYEQFLSNHGIEESKCAGIYSLWYKEDRIGTAIKS